MKQKEKRLTGISAGILLSACFSFLMFVYAPLELYLTNIKDFWIKLNELVFPVAVVFVIGFAGCSAGLIIARLISKKLYSICLAVGGTALLGAYIQGNFLIKNLPPMDGVHVVWSDYPMERLKSVLAFAVPFIILVVLLIVLRYEKFRKVIAAASTCLLLLFVITLTTLLVTTDTRKSDLLVSTVKNEFQMSTDKNLIILILDTVNSKDFQASLENNPEFRDELDGFTLYDNALAAYPHTTRSIPMILTGKWYENDSRFSDYQTDAFSSSPLFTALNKNGYKTAIYNESVIELSKDKFENQFENFYSAKVSYKPNAVYSFVIKMGGVKYFPWDFKKYSWFLQNFSHHCRVIDSEYEGFEWNDIVFYNSVKDSNPITLTEEKCARIIHLQGAHVPHPYDKYFNVLEKGSYDQSVDASATLVTAYLKRLKESGVYDNSAIVILADHGYTVEEQNTNEIIKKKMNPLLMVKGTDENHEMNISTAPVSYTDIADGCVRLINSSKGDSAFGVSEGEKRTRRMLFYIVKNENHMDEYITDGYADDLSAMTATGKVYDR